MAKAPDPTADPKFLETVRRMLKTPPKPHKPTRKNGETKASPKLRDKSKAS